jgi:hypothetical protein
MKNGDGMTCKEEPCDFILDMDGRVTCKYCKKAKENIEDYFWSTQISFEE